MPASLYSFLVHFSRKLVKKIARQTPVTFDFKPKIAQTRRTQIQVMTTRYIIIVFVNQNNVVEIAHLVLVVEHSFFKIIIMT